MTCVVDSSVVLAAILGEPGGEVFDVPGQVFHLSTVNLAEIYTKVLERGGIAEDVDLFLAPLPIRIRAFREPHPLTTARLRAATRHLGLSLGDRACLSLGIFAGLPVLTADRDWAKLDIGVDVRLIR
jgi:ribonuclease VapC